MARTDAAPDDAASVPAPRREGRRPTRGSIAVGLVAALAGALFATNAALFRGAGERHPQNLAELVGTETRRMEAVADDVNALRSEVQALVDAENSRTPVIGPDRTDVELAAGALPVRGPGVVVRLWDAPSTNAPAGARPDDLVVHQGDLEAVMNALWAGGAEAMMIQGTRVTSTTAVRCVGSVLLMSARTYSPPYEVAVVGDPEALMGALDASPGVQIYLQYVEVLRLGWSVEAKDMIEIPAADGAQDVKHAVVSVGEEAAA